MQLEFRVLELLSSRLCHELISPIGAINNGVELMGEEDADFVKDAMGLIAQSAKRAGQRLQFYRFAYGAGGAGGGAPDAKTLVAGILEGGKVAAEWQDALSALPPEWQKLGCNLALVAAEILPRGGKVVLASAGDKKITATATGETINVMPELKAALGEGADVSLLTARTIHAYFTSRMAAKLGAKLALTQPDPGRAVFTIA
jgi:histidine phosphotransferase ChpT